MEAYNRDQVVAIGYHMNWPGANDPYYLQNPTDNTARRSYYGVTGIPYYVINGSYDSSVPSQSAFSSAISSRLNQESSYEILIDPHMVDDGVQATIQIVCDEAISGNLKLYSSLVEEYVHWSTPGPNGVDEYYYPMLQFRPNAQGVTLTADAGDTLTYTYTFDYSTQWDISNLAVVCWLQQSTSPHEVMQANLGPVPTDTPSLSYVSHTVVDDDAADPNGRPDPGETVDMRVLLTNRIDFQPTQNLTGTLTCEDPAVTIDDATGTWPEIVPMAQVANVSDPFSITVPEDYVAQYVTFTVHLVDDSGYETDVSFLQLVGRPDVLLVNDFGNGRDASERWFQIFNDAGFAAEFKAGNEAASSGLNDYPVVIWTTSTGDGDVLDANEVSAISDYLDNGGNLLLTGENIGEDEGAADWFHTYFAAEHAADSAPSQSRVRVVSVPDGPFPGSDLILVGGDSQAEAPSTITPLVDATTFFNYIAVEDIAGVGHRTDTYSTVYLAFDVSMANGMSGTTTSDQMINTLIDWMRGITDVPGDNGQAALPVSISLATWPNPFNAEMTVRYELPARQQVTLSVYNLIGQQVATLAQGPAAAGQHLVTWNASDLASGVYLVRLDAGATTKLQKVLLVK